jgi:hypothetical protein
VGVAFSPTARNIFRQWEKLRLVYLAVLAGVCLWFAGPRGLATGEVAGVLIKGAIAANVLYFAGPLLETYVAWVGFRPKWLRWLLFIGGTLFSVFLAIVVLLFAMYARLD